jgi:hypothetical protein
MLHQDITQEPVSQYSRILFVEPGTSSSFNNLTFRTPVGNALTIDVKLFCEDMVSAVQTWLPKACQLPQVAANLSKSATRHPAGLRPFIVGVPVIG